MSLLTMQLRPASFRGVSFSVSDAEYNGGRRTALHEYPQRDTPYVEDMGRATREYSMTALVVGSDYIARAKELMAALEKPGAGRLVHPWLGELSVIATSVGTLTFSNSLGMASVSLTFVEAGEKLYPGMGTSWVAALRNQIDATLDAAAEAFADVIELANQADYIIAEAADTWGVLVQACATCEALVYTGMVEALQAVDFVQSITDPEGFAGSVADALGFNRLAGTSRDWKHYSETLITLANRPEFAAVHGAHVVGSSDERIENNDNALKALMRNTLLAQSAGCASFVGTASDTADVTEEVETTSYDSMISLRDDICAGLEAEMLQTDSDEMAIELEDLRSNVFSEMTERAEQQARLHRVDFPARRPLVVAAYELYQDADRADELGRLNAIRNIGFSPEGGLIALSE